PPPCRQRRDAGRDAVGRKAGGDRLGAALGSVPAVVDLGYSCKPISLLLHFYENRNSFKPKLWEKVDNTAPGMHAPMAVNVNGGRSVGPSEYLTEGEIEKLIKAGGETRWGHRDATAILFAYRHGLRASELVALRWDDIDFQPGKLHVRRAKGGTASVHPIGGRELRALRRLKREAPAS